MIFQQIRSFIKKPFVCLLVRLIYYTESMFTFIQAKRRLLSPQLFFPTLPIGTETRMVVTSLFLEIHVHFSISIAFVLTMNSMRGSRRGVVSGLTALLWWPYCDQQRSHQNTWATTFVLCMHKVLTVARTAIQLRIFLELCKIAVLE